MRQQFYGVLAHVQSRAHQEYNFTFPFPIPQNFCESSRTVASVRFCPAGDQLFTWLCTKINSNVQIHIHWLVTTLVISVLWSFSWRLVPSHHWTSFRFCRWNCLEILGGCPETTRDSHYRRWMAQNLSSVDPGGSASAKWNSDTSLHFIYCWKTGQEPVTDPNSVVAVSLTTAQFFCWHNCQLFTWWELLPCQIWLKVWRRCSRKTLVSTSPW